ncbi:hypothetical protein [Rathayibacter sp. SD072]|uniref:hypothetical protein n=1 Tax=Rathayibacter sp. SD072 TaxID=2781731 RepID=UPI001A959EF3|nr:hypothetical protein [Rathayibacter sp. SD072]MBO0984564.1 hypothetical protein [Rathayibacter sp. SD072]
MHTTGLRDSLARRPALHDIGAHMHVDGVLRDPWAVAESNIDGISFMTTLLTEPSGISATAS